MAKIEPFERNTQQYEDWFAANRFVYSAELRAVEELLQKQGRGVEIGVGSGRFAQPLGIRFGVDPSPKMCRLAFERGVNVAEGVGEALPFRSNVFDFALMVTTVCFLDDVQQSFQEVKRVLKPGGDFVVGFIDRDSPVGRLYQKQKAENVFYRSAKFFSVNEVRRFMIRVGFAHLAFRQTILGMLNEIKNNEPVKEGYGLGSFVAVRGAAP